MNKVKQEFQNWFKQQSFYQNLVFIHGDRLFNFDRIDGYSILSVQIAWLTWQEQQKKIDVIEQITNENSRLLESIVLEKIKGVLGIESKHPCWEADK